MCCEGHRKMWGRKKLYTAHKAPELYPKIINQINLNWQRKGGTGVKKNIPPSINTTM